MTEAEVGERFGHAGFKGGGEDYEPSIAKNH